jgi:hypothetical protein
MTRIAWGLKSKQVLLLRNSLRKIGVRPKLDASQQREIIAAALNLYTVVYTGKK